MFLVKEKNTTIEPDATVYNAPCGEVFNLEKNKSIAILFSSKQFRQINIETSQNNSYSVFAILNYSNTDYYMQEYSVVDENGAADTTTSGSLLIPPKIITMGILIKRNNDGDDDMKIFV